MDQDDNTQNDGASEPVDGAKLMAEFDAKLMAELGIDKLSEEEQKGAREDIESLINTRIINLAMIYVPEEKVEEFKNVAEKEDPTQLSIFLQQVVPNWNDKVLSELMQIRDELLED